MPAAARITDLHTCPKMEPGPVPHVGGPVISGDVTVLIGYQPAARAGDSLVCVGPPDSISAGEPTVIIGNKEAARMGDPTSHGGRLVIGHPTVLIGSTPQSETLATDLPFCEECEKARKAAEAAEAAKA
jgi:uncharacterized Zn-binding protein involved in type VI secretion